VIVNLVGGLLGQVIGLFGAKGKAQQEQMASRISALGRSWTDEFIAVVWFSPLIVSWISPDRAQAWIDTITSQDEYFSMLVGITLAVFGIGKLNGRK